ncbi:MAG: cobalamin biosynthesis protein [Sinorhizobium meliloti]|uniref:adenosylcobinamide-phosphate synthase CbiB n=1 Tax=Sinorhizobium TaxID=28105 RepID=UPI0023D7E862|nr:MULTISPECIES: adenosylcobinamide-phosphate synthase CbiB [unclassified Sinorhizobium]MCG5484857.1 cobalamin biosynthesis protein [Sinorhizobium meliloti]WEJ08980.1 adenosylcobinamide-phosphate synthase CbiB [Sinorhizobium sp. M103]WEJ35938.1 adenosylcobinamide-phosphate synthase CbiB [Sinorhizobium sp. C101]
MSAEILLILVMALLLDRILGDPDWLWSRLTHPVVFFGKAVEFVDEALNRGEFTKAWLKFRGVVGILVLLAGATALGVVLARLFDVLGALGSLLEVVTVAVFLAQKSLADHVSRVAVGLRRDGLAGGRKAVSMIVGRDPNTLDEPAVCRAAIESLAENFSDGVVAPAFWYAVAGLPGLLAYKMLNTADSMIGHKSPKYLHFGWASARLDDLANLPAARLSALLIAAGAYFRRGAEAAKTAIEVARRDHGLHRSPNSGWPEAAMAGAVGIQLAGPRIYGGVKVDEPMMNDAGRAVAAIEDIEAAVTVFYAACSVMALAFAIVALPLLVFF